MTCRTTATRMLDSPPNRRGTGPYARWCGARQFYEPARTGSRSQTVDSGQAHRASVRRRTVGDGGDWRVASATPGTFI